MLIKQIDVKDAQARLLELVSQTTSGMEWVLMNDTVPVARLVPLSSRVAGLHEGAIWTSSDFDEPLPDDFWTGSA